jgi:hypothetical protein
MRANAHLGSKPAVTAPQHSWPVHLNERTFGPGVNNSYLRRLDIHHLPLRRRHAKQPSNHLPAADHAARSLPQGFTLMRAYRVAVVVHGVARLQRPRNKTFPHITTKPPSRHTPGPTKTDRAHSRRLSDFGYDVILQVTTMPGLKN